jgi:hypothetical protein
LKQRHRSGWSVYPDHLIRAVRQGLDSRVYSVRLTGEIRVERAENDAAMALCSAQMELKEMTAIVR